MKMRLDQLKNVSKLFVINFLVFIVLCIIIELLMGDWFISDEQRKKGIVEYNLSTYKNYFPEIIHTRKLDNRDGGTIIENYINQSRIRVENISQIKFITDFQIYDVINIGDSFMQADEIQFNKTLSAVLEKETGQKVLQVGFSSWAPINMLKWLEQHELKKGVHVNIFTMMNDYTPHYADCNLAYHNFLIYDNVTATSHFPLDVHKPSKGFSERSFFFKAIRKIWYDIFKSKPELFDKQLLNVQLDCQLLEKIEESGISNLTLDYVTFAFDSTCWNHSTKTAVNSAIIDINNIVELVKTRGGTSTVFLIPAGWSFEGECYIGKASNSYNMSQNALITTSGLSIYLEQHLKSQLVSLEKIINDLKVNNERIWYFPVDGHWTDYAHNQLGKWMAKKILSY